MDGLVLEGNRYKAIFLDAKKENEKDYEYTCWHSSPSMWWEGKTVLTDKQTGREVRAIFETFHRAGNVDDGIKNETLEESLLLVRGKDDMGRFVSYKGGKDVVLDKNGIVDYLIEQVYREALGRSHREFIPHVEIPLLEQHLLAEKDYAKPEPMKSK